MKRKISVLFIDQGVAFGGSLVVIANLVHCLNPDKFRAVVVAEMAEKIVRSHIKGKAKVIIAKHNFNYVHWQRIVNALQCLPGKFLKKTGIYLFSITRIMINILYAIKIALVVIRERVDLIHINNGTDNFEANLTSLLFSRKRVVHLHGVGKLSIVERLFLRFVPRVIAISEFVRSEMIKSGIPAHKIIVMPNPVLPEIVASDARERVRKRLGIGVDIKLFGIFGRIVEWKGQKEFLQAAQLVLHQVDHSKALIVGDISDGEEGYLRDLHQFLLETGLQDRVIFTGYARNVAELYNAVDVVVHASIEPEPFGLVITEAMAYGIPVVASSLGAPREIIDDAHDGYLVHPKDTRKFASIIIRLLQDDELRHEMGARAKKKVLEMYDAERYARNIENLYRQILSA